MANLKRVFAENDSRVQKGEGANTYTAGAWLVGKKKGGQVGMSGQFAGTS